MFPLTSLPGIVRATALCWLSAVALMSASVSASPRLRCQLGLGGEMRIAEFTPVQDPYSVEAIDLGGRFRFKAVVVGDEQRIEYIALYVYYQSPRQAVLLQEAKYLAPIARIEPNPAALTGTNYLYSPELERELQYSCALLEVAR